VTSVDTHQLTDKETTMSTYTVIHTRQSGPDGYRGKTVDSIVRREYGRKATVRWSADPNSPHAGQIVRPAIVGGGWIVLGTLLSVETINQ
jgi:hypothetical protein